MKHSWTPLFAALGLLQLAGCQTATTDPFDRPYTWRPTGINDDNLRAMLVNPNDMVVGQAARGSIGVLANASVSRVMQDKVKALPKVDTGSGAPGGDAGGGGGGTTTGLGATGGGQ
jgi:hypothetical protein